AFAAIAVGVIKIVVGLNRDRPVGFLVAMCLAAFVVALIAFARRPLRSRKGDAALKELKSRHIGPQTLGRNLAGVSTAEFATIVGLFGMTALSGTELSDLRTKLQPPAGNGSS